MRLRNIVIAFFFLSTVQLLMLKMQVMRLSNSTQLSAQKLVALVRKVDMVKRAGDPYIIQMEESITNMAEELTTLRQSNEYLLEHAGQTDEKMEVMEQFRTRMESSADLSI